LWGTTRPGLATFLQFCFSFFRIVGVWSAGRRKYVDAIVDVCFRGLPKPHVVFNWDQCRRLSGRASDALVDKPIQEMIDSDSELAKYMSLSNTVILDDRYTAFSMCNLKNGILIPEYNPSPPTVFNLRADDPSLQQLMYWFQTSGFKDVVDVRTMDKSMIFKTSIADYQKKLGIRQTSVGSNSPSNLVFDPVQFGG